MAMTRNLRMTGAVAASDAARVLRDPAATSAERSAAGSALAQAPFRTSGKQQRARFLKDNTIGPRLELVRRFAVFTNQYPWQWEPAEAEAFITRSPVAVSTARNYQNTLRLFCGYASAARYGWRTGAWSSSGRHRGRSSMSGTRSGM